MKVDLPEHVVACLKVLFHRVQPLRVDVDMIAVLVNSKRVQHPLEVVHSVFGAGYQAVAKEVVHPVAVKLRRHQLRDKRRRVSMLIQRSQLLGKLFIEGAKNLIYFRRVVENNAARPLFMMKAKDLLQDVREWTMPEIVKQRSG